MRFALIVATGLLLVTGSAIAQQRQLQQPRQQPNQQQAAPDTRGTEQTPFIVKTMPGEKSESDKQAEKEKTELDRKLTEFTGNLASYTWWLFIVTGGVVLGTFGLVITGFLQINDNKKVIKATQTSANASLTQANVMKATYAAHVAIVSPKSSADLDQRGGALLKMSFWLTLKNNGQSQTQNMRSTIAAKSLRLGEEFIYDFPGAVDDPPHGMVIGPEVELNTGTIEIDAKIIYEAVIGSIRLFLYGWTEYDDIFPDTMRHRLEYCYQIRVQPVGGWVTNFDSYGPHNRHYDIPRPPLPVT